MSSLLNKRMGGVASVKMMHLAWPLMLKLVSVSGGRTETGRACHLLATEGGDNAVRLQGCKCGGTLTRLVSILLS